MTYAPPLLTELARYWVSKGGVNLGVVGDTAHQARGVSYHLGADKLAAGAYSRQTARDKAGLTNAASAIDLGRLDGSLGKLRSFSHWLIQECQRNAPGTRDIREVIYSPDGRVVLRYDRERGVASLPRPGEASTSHYTHTHVSFYRDSEKRDKVGIFDGYFAGEVTPPDTATEDPNVGVSFTPTKAERGTFTLNVDANLIDTSTGKFTPVVKGYVRNTMGIVSIVDGAYAGKAAYLVTSNKRSQLALVSHGTYVPAVVVEDCTAEVASAVKADRAKARITYS